jgi:hypothetical protein
MLIALGNGSGSLIGPGAIALAALFATTAVASFWPRRFPSLDPTRLGDYAVSELAFTQLTVLDTFEVMIRQTSRMLEAKSRRLKWALVRQRRSRPLGRLPQRDPKLITYLERGQSSSVAEKKTRPKGK